jgi:hypothetical protein
MISGSTVTLYVCTSIFVVVRRVPALSTLIIDNLLIRVYKKVKFLRKAEATSRNKRTLRIITIFGSRFCSDSGSVAVLLVGVYTN